MPIEIQCQQCQARFRVGDQYAGKRVKCAKCRATIVVEPAAAPAETRPEEAAAEAPEGQKPAAGEPAVKEPGAKQPAAKEPVQLKKAAADDAGDWFMQTEEGEQYGPVTKAELDAWVAEGRLDAGCQVLRDGWEQWKWAEEVYPQLSGTPAAPPAVEPLIEVAPVVSTAPAAVLPEVAVAPVAVENVAPAVSFAQPRESRGRRQYPALKTAANIYAVVAWIVLALGGLAAIGYAVAFFATGIGSAGVAGIVMFLIGELAIGLYTFIGFISLKAASEFINLAIHVEHNTHDAAESAARMAQALASRKTEA